MCGYLVCAVSDQIPVSQAPYSLFSVSKMLNMLIVRIIVIFLLDMVQYGARSYVLCLYFKYLFRQ